MHELVLTIQTIPLLLQAALVTVAIAGAGLAVGTCIAVCVCASRLSRSSALQFVGGAYVFFFRGVPLLIQLLLIYGFLPFVGINAPPIVAALSAVALCCAAYVAEILRGGFLALPRGHLEAAQMLGLSPLDRLLRIQIPQTVRLTLPSLANEAVLVIKASSLISVVGVAELTRTAQNVAASTYRPLEAYLACGFVYLCINGLIAWSALRAENRMGAAW